MKPKGLILLVEDDPDLADNLVEILEGLDWQVEVAPSAEHALQVLSTRTFTGVITDFRLPGLGGVELISRLRQRGVGVPIVVMSAFIDDAAAAQAERAGALGVLAKPLDLKCLFSLLEEFLRRDERVLIVEDNLALAENVAEALREQGFAPEVVSDGSGALASRHLPRMALVDLRLPDLDGIEVARRLWARDPSIKILFVTAYVEEMKPQLDRAVCELPCLDPVDPCLSKPFDVPALVERIRCTVQS